MPTDDDRAYYEKLDALILEAKKDWESSKRRGGRPKKRKTSKKGKKLKPNESGDAWHLGRLAGLKEARLTHRFHRAESKERRKQP